MTKRRTMTEELELWFDELFSEEIYKQKVARRVAFEENAAWAEFHNWETDLYEDLRERTDDAYFDYLAGN